MPALTTDVYLQYSQVWLGLLWNRVCFNWLIIQKIFLNKIIESLPLKGNLEKREPYFKLCICKICCGRFLYFLQQISNLPRGYHPEWLFVTQESKNSQYVLSKNPSQFRKCYLAATNKELIPAWWRWYARVNPLAWTLHGLVASQFGDVKEALETGENLFEITLLRDMNFSEQLQLQLLPLPLSLLSHFLCPSSF